jgi:xanthine dehydrogenase accessory factor
LPLPDQAAIGLKEGMERAPGNRIYPVDYIAKFGGDNSVWRCELIPQPIGAIAMIYKLILVRGTGDVASAVAHLLFSEGHRVACHDLTAPTHARRGMAFADTAFEGFATLEGVLARRASSLDALAYMLGCGRAIPVTTDEFQTVLGAVRPTILIDARMRKRSVPETQVGLAPLTIGLGPNFIAAETVDVAIETSWGHELGNVLTSGSTRALAGEPRELVGYGRERFVYASRAGLFQTDRYIGEAVEKGEPVATLGGQPLFAPLSGCIRGLLHDLVPVEKGTKVIEVDPRGERGLVFGLGERPRRIAAGVLRAIDDRVEPTPYLFRFEADFERALECVPMLARFKLDACGIKVPLSDWRKLPIIVRRRLLEMPGAEGNQITIYRSYLTEMIERHTRGPVRSLPIGPAPAWSEINAVAPNVVQKAEGLGVNAPSIEQWRRLTPLQRFALVKLAGASRGRNFLPALREFSLV